MKKITSIVAVLVRPAQADINIGIVASLTGPAAALGGDTRRALALMPATVGSEKVNYNLLSTTRRIRQRP